jgi:isopentenyl diphosphate isomerase/L-lactate dehydrogenase-like FMN-dependent dehydrogenase
VMVRFTCVTKSGGYHADPHPAIERLGWINEKTRETGIISRFDVYNWIKKEDGHGFVRDTQGKIVIVGTREHANGTKYVQTLADGVWSNNLLSLPECL